jgi:D-alanyl-D-alanine carboxypeptidase
VRGYVARKDMWASAENTGPDSGVTATASDVRRMLAALFLTGGSQRHIGDAMRADPVETGKPRQRTGAGSEVRTSRGGPTLIGHTGDVEGYLSFAYAAPDTGATLVGHLTASDADQFGALLRETVAVVEQACANR